MDGGDAADLSYGRPDVLPVTDYGVRKGFALTFQRLPKNRAHRGRDLPKPDVVFKRGQKWRPFRSVASWYLWRACDLAKTTPPAGRAVGKRLNNSAFGSDRTQRDGKHLAARQPTIVQARPLSACTGKHGIHRDATSASMGTFISPPARTRGSRPLRRRIPRRPITTGTSASARSVTPPTARRER